MIKGVLLAGVANLLLTGTFVAVFNFSVGMAALIAIVPTLVIFGVILAALDVF